MCEITQYYYYCFKVLHELIESLRLRVLYTDIIGVCGSMVSAVQLMPFSFFPQYLIILRSQIHDSHSIIRRASLHCCIL